MRSNALPDQALAFGLLSDVVALANENELQSSHVSLKVTGRGELVIALVVSPSRPGEFTETSNDDVSPASPMADSHGITQPFHRRSATLPRTLETPRAALRRAGGTP